MMKTFARPRLLVLALYIASAALVTVQQAILRHSNNVSIFRSASFNLFAGRDLRGPPGTALRLLQVQPDLRCAVRARRLFALRAHVSVLDSAQRAAAVV